MSVGLRPHLHTHINFCIPQKISKNHIARATFDLTWHTFSKNGWIYNEHQVCILGEKTQPWARALSSFVCWYISFLFFWVFFITLSVLLNICVVMRLRCQFYQLLYAINFVWFLFYFFDVSDRHQYGILLSDLVRQIHSKIGVWRTTDLGATTSKR